MSYVLLAGGIGGIAFMLFFLVMMCRESNPVWRNRRHKAKLSLAIEHFMLTKPTRRRLTVLLVVLVTGVASLSSRSQNTPASESMTTQKS
jgi:hypothetical protein